MSGKIVIIDYGVGNLHSVEKALRYVGAEVTVTAEKKRIMQAEKIILPGVGAFGDCMKNLHRAGLVPVIQEILASERPFLGICLGMQLLFEESEEAPGVAGLGYFPGKVEALRDRKKIPHMGWNELRTNGESPLLEKRSGNYVYFVHSYEVVPADKSIITATCDYEGEVTAAVGAGNVQAVQFHPEKSSNAGLAILKRFKEWQL